MTKDLTTGEPWRVLWRFSLPLLGSIIFQQLYNIADSFVAGKFIGDNALSAVGNSYEVTLIYLAFAFGCNMGCNVVIARLFGGKQLREVKSAVNTTYIASGALCILLMVLGFVFSPALLRLINTPAEIMGDTLLYLNIYTGGLLFLFFYNISTGIFSALGDSRTPFLFLAVSSVTNIFMDIWFVYRFQMGIAGVAWATFLCQGVSCVAAVITVFIKLRKIKCEGRPQVFSFPLLKQIVRIAVPSILQQSFISVGNILIQSIVNSFGTVVIAGYSAAIKVNNFAITTLSTMGNAMSSYTAQNLGAGKMDRIRRGGRAGILLSAGIAVLFSLLYVFLKGSFISLFIKVQNTASIEEGKMFLLVVAPTYILPGIKLIADGTLRGLGRMKYFMISTFTDLSLRVILAFVFSDLLGSVGIWCAWPVGWLVSTVMSLIFYKQAIDKQRQI